jgi:antitoxin component YwqK of YwqJK toxin-antitoxin module
MNKRYGVLCSVFSILLLSPVNSDPGEAGMGSIEETDAPPVTLWFISNAAGQALRNAYSLTALREKYALSVMPVSARFVPDEFKLFYQDGWKAECRTLYEEGELLRIQWVFTDENRITRFVSAKSPEGAGFAEVYNERGLLTKESRFDAPFEEETEDGELITRESVPLVITYQYRGDFVTGARSNAWVDTYRYRRNNQIRAIDRTYLDTNTHARVSLPRTIQDISFNSGFFVSPTSTYTSVFLQDVLLDTGSEVTYTLDDKGRILTETRRNGTGEVSGTVSTLWDDDRIVQVVWESGDDKRRVVYTYNEDNERAGEKNYRNETLERETTISGEEEIETLYRDGKPLLRAFWKDGKKIREEAVREEKRTMVVGRRGL